MQPCLKTLHIFRDCPGVQTKTDQCARVNTTVILHTHLFYAQSKNISTFLLAQRGFGFSHSLQSKVDQKMGELTEQLRGSCDANFKIVVVKAVETSNNCQDKKYGVTE